MLFHSLTFCLVFIYIYLYITFFFIYFLLFLFVAHFCIYLCAKNCSVAMISLGSNLLCFCLIFHFFFWPKYFCLEFHQGKSTCFFFFFFKWPFGLCCSASYPLFVNHNYNSSYRQAII